MIRQRQYPGVKWLGAVLWATLIVANAGTANDAEAQTLDYHPVVLQDDGSVDRESLDRLAETIRADAHAGSTQVVVMVHGFNTDLDGGRKGYAAIAKQFREEAAEVGLNAALVGIHWDSRPAAGWVAQAAGHRFLSLIGFKNAVRNPYLDSSKLATRIGQAGLRSVLFRLEDEFPTLPVNLLAHSLGAEVLVSALTPEARKAGGPVEQPGRAVKLSLAVLAGADLDHDAFSRKEAAALRAGLDCVGVWWVTVPEKDRADGVLEMRRGAGRRDAVGNRGLQLPRETLNALLARRGLVIDEGSVPTDHLFTRYYGEQRLRSVAASLLYLERPEAAAARNSVLGALDAVRAGQTVAQSPQLGRSVELYAAWRQEHPEAVLTSVAGAREEVRAEAGARVH